MIYENTFKGSRSIILEDKLVKVIVLPEIGGKIASVYNKPKAFELLFQNKEETYKKANIYDSFEKFDASGFDDAFPSIDQGMVKVGEALVKYPDHGEIWSMKFQYETEGEKLILSCSSSILSYNYIKVLSLKDGVLKIRYEITNHGAADIPCLWAMHCLIRCEEDMRLIFPGGTQEVRNVFGSRHLGKLDKIHPYPVTVSEDGNSFYLDRIFPEAANKCEKYYVNGEVSEGVAGAYYPGKDVNYRVYFDREKLPYLGFWLTEGGFRGDYNCAMEPANGFYDSIDIAVREKAIYILKAGGKLEFELKIEVK